MPLDWLCRCLYRLQELTWPPLPSQASMLQAVKRRSPACKACPASAQRWTWERCVCWTSILTILLCHNKRQGGIILCWKNYNSSAGSTAHAKSTWTQLCNVLQGRQSKRCSAKDQKGENLSSHPNKDHQAMQASIPAQVWDTQCMPSTR